VAEVAAEGEQRCRTHLGDSKARVCGIAEQVCQAPELASEIFDAFADLQRRLASPQANTRVSDPSRRVRYRRARRSSV
jgi:hypothetical protein